MKKAVGTTFHDIVMNPHKDVIINFYAPWCPYSVALEPTWQDLASRFEGVESLTVAAFDDTQNEVPGLHVHAYPTIMFYSAEDKANPHTFRAPNRFLETIVTFAMAHATIPFVDPPTGRWSQQVHRAPEVPAGASAAREIADAKAWEEEVVAKPNQNSFVMLYAPWCSHSKELFPVWDELATDYHFVESVLVAKFDATRQDAPLAAKTQIYPTLRFFPANAKDLTVDYKGPKTAQNMREFIMKEAPKKEEPQGEQVQAQEHAQVEEGDDKANPNPDAGQVGQPVDTEAAGDGEQGRVRAVRPEGVADPDEGRFLNEKEGYAHKQSMKVKRSDDVKNYL